MDRIEVDELPDQHGTLRIQAVLDADLEGSIFFQVPRKLSLLYEDDEGEKPLFSGLLVRSSMKRKGKYLYLELEAKSHTYQMDLKRGNPLFPKRRGNRRAGDPGNLKGLPGLHLHGTL